jgi:anti-sigma B factor antagonist
MQIAEQRQGAVTVVKPQGPLCLGDAEQFRAHLSEVLVRSLGRFVVDATAVPYVDSSGLEALVKITEELGQSGRALKLCGACETVRETLDLTELSPMFEHFEDVNTAVRSFL